jgi:hypothetical protein
MGGEVINTLKYHSQKNPTNKKLKTELHYFRNNRHRMQYALALKSNYPIGSGLTEVTIKNMSDSTNEICRNALEYK